MGKKTDQARAAYEVREQLRNAVGATRRDSIANEEFGLGCKLIITFANHEDRKRRPTIAGSVFTADSGLVVAAEGYSMTTSHNRYYPDDLHLNAKSPFAPSFRKSGLLRFSSSGFFKNNRFDIQDCETGIDARILPDWILRRASALLFNSATKVEYQSAGAPSLLQKLYDQGITTRHGLVFNDISQDEIRAKTINPDFMAFDVADTFVDTGIKQMPYSSPQLSQDEIDAIFRMGRNWMAEQKEKHRGIVRLIDPWPMQLGTYPHGWSDEFKAYGDRELADVKCFHQGDVDAALADELKAVMG